MVKTTVIESSIAQARGRTEQAGITEKKAGMRVQGKNWLKIDVTELVEYVWVLCDL